MLARIKSEFHVEHFKITFANHQNFIICRWQSFERVSVWFLIYRLVYFLSVLVIILYYVTAPCYKPKSIIYISVWAGYLWLLQVTFGLVCVTVGYIDQNYNTTFVRRPILYGMYWVVYCTYADLCLGISFFYWGLVQFDGDPHKVNFTNVALHALNSIVPIIDMFIAAVPVRILHVYTSFGHTSFYLICNYLYCALGGTNLMEQDYVHLALNWNHNLGSALLTASLSFPVIFIFRFFNFCLYILRTKFYRLTDYSSYDSN